MRERKRRGKVSLEVKVHCVGLSLSLGLGDLSLVTRFFGTLVTDIRGHTRIFLDETRVASSSTP